VAAAELAFKQYVAAVAPEAQWLVENVQSPPLVKMLDKYLPTLKARNEIRETKPKIPKALTKSLEALITSRNHIVHRRPERLPHRELRKRLLAVRDLLYLLDFYKGERWAWRNLNLETQTALTAST